MPKPDTIFEQDKKELRNMLRQDMQAVTEEAQAMSSKSPQPRPEQLDRYRRMRDDKIAWQQELQDRIRAIGPEKPLAMQRAVAQVMQYAQWGESELSKLLQET